MDQASAAAERSRAVFDRLAASARQARSASQSQSAFNTALGIGSGPGKSAQESAAAMLKLQAQASDELAAKSTALRAVIDPLGAAQIRMNSAVSDADMLLAKGAINQGEHTAAVALARKEYATAEQALKRFAATGGMTTAQVMALTAATRHSVDAMIAGRPPWQALTMEAGNLSFALGGGAGLSGVLALARSALTALLSPTALVIGGIAGLAGAVAVAVTAFRAGIIDQKDLQASLAGVGRAAGISAEQMELVAQTVHEAAGVSVAEARKMEEQFAGTGKIGGDMFGGLIRLVRDYAATTHQNTDQATKDLAAIFSDPAKGIDTLIQRVGGIDDKTRQYVLTLAAQGERQKAQLELLKVLPGQLQKAGDQTDALGRSAGKLELAWSGTWESIKRALGGISAAQQMTDLQSERAAASKGFGLSVDGVMSAPRALKDIDRDISAVQAKLDALTGKAKAAQANMDAKDASLAVGNLSRSILGFADLDSLINGQKELNKQMADPAVRQRIANLQQAKDAQDAYARAIATYLTPEQKAQQLADLEAKALADRTPKQKADTAAKREAIEISGKLMTTAQASADVERARSAALREASRAEVDRAKQVATETRVLDENTAAALDSSRAWLISAAAGMKADAARRGLTDSIKKGPEAEARGRQILQQQIAEMADEGGRQARSMADQTAEQTRLNDAVAAGTMTTEDARQQMATWSALRPLIIAQDLAEGDAKRDLTEVIKALTAAYGNDNAQARRSQAQQMVEDQRIGIDLLEKEVGLQNLGENARERELAILQAKSDLLRDHIDLESKEGQEYIANAAKAAGLNQNLRLADATRQEIEGTFDSLANDASQFFRQSDVSWKAWGNLGLSILQDLEDEFFKLAAINPLKNALFGGNNPTLSSAGGLLGSIFGEGGSAGKVFGGGVGTWIASLFHEGLNAGPVGAGLGASRIVSVEAFRNARRMHGGGLVGDEVPIIAKKGEVVGWPSQMAAAFGGGSVIVNQTINGHVYGDDALKDVARRAAQDGAQAGFRLVKDNFISMQSEARERYG
jgi:hypothetical protein